MEVTPPEEASMRPALLLLLLLTITSLPSRSEADIPPPNVVLLACDTLSTDSLRVRFTFGLQNPTDGYHVCNFRLFPQNPDTHVLSCSTSAFDWRCFIYAPFGTSVPVWTYGGETNCIEPGQSLAPFEFVMDQGSACFDAVFSDIFFQTTREGLCFSCAGLEAVPVKPLTWGKVKATYR